MKRMSLLVLTVSLLSASPAHAWNDYDYIPLRYRVRYSPLAFGYRHNGLISGYHSDYSVHAFGLQGNGLVSVWTRYSPYAFGIGHDGLVEDDGSWSRRWGTQHRRTPCLSSPLVSTPTPAVRTSAPRGPGARPAIPRPRDQRRIVQETLQRTQAGPYRFARSFKLDADYVTFDVVLNEGRTIVKYWNPRLIRQLRASDSGSAKRFEHYLTTWVAMSLTHEAEGGEVYHVMTDAPAEIRAQFARALTDLQQRHRLVCSSSSAGGPTQRH